MSLLSNIRQKFGTAAGYVVRKYAPHDDYWYQPFTPPATAGVEVNEETSLSLSTVYACISLLSDTVAALPLKLYRKISEDERVEITTDRIVNLLKKPNPEMTGFRFRNLCQAYILGWGNAYVYVQRDLADRIIGLWPLYPQAMSVSRAYGTAELTYTYRTSQGTNTWGPRNIWHLRGFGYSGTVGYSPIQLHREGISLAMAQVKYGAKFFGEGTHPGAVVEHPGKLGNEARQHLQSSLMKRYSGLGNAHKLLVLEEGMQLKPVVVPPQDAMYIESQNFSVEDICRIYRVPPHLVQSLKRSTFNNIEHQGIDFTTHSVSPWLKRWESELDDYFVMDGRQNGQRLRKYWEHNIDGLLRGDFKSRMDGYSTALQNGIMTRNEVRAKENLPPVGEEGDILTVQVNMTDLSYLLEPPEVLPANEPPPEEVEEIDEEIEQIEEKAIRGVLMPPGREDEIRADMVDAALNGLLAMRNTWRPLITEAARRVVNKEAAAVAKAIDIATRGMNVAKFEDWSDAFYKDFRIFVGRQMQPVITSYAKAVHGEITRALGKAGPMTPELASFTDRYVKTYALRHASFSSNQLKKILADELQANVGEAIKTRALEWKEKRPFKIADDEVIRAQNAFAREVYAGHGATHLVWVAVGKSCRFCKTLDGTKSRIRNDAFAGADEPVIAKKWSNKKSPGWTTTAIRPKRDVKHPPLHKG